MNFVIKTLYPMESLCIIDEGFSSKSAYELLSADELTSACVQGLFRYRFQLFFTFQTQ